MNFLPMNSFLQANHCRHQKTILFVVEQDSVLSEIKNAVFMGTSVARGNAKGIVYATGMKTEIGKISSFFSKNKINRMLLFKERCRDVAKKLMYATFVIGALLFGTRLLLNDSISSGAYFFYQRGQQQWYLKAYRHKFRWHLHWQLAGSAKRNAIVKKIASAQTLGSATVIASDKTGTITKNEMTITGCHLNGKTFSVSGLGYKPEGQILDEKGQVLEKDSLGDLKVFFLSGFLSSTGKIHPPDKYHQGWYCIGDPTEASFAALAMKAGFSLEDVEKDYRY
jgi:Ca2+-transporting ATPase